METFSALLAICAGNLPVPVNSPHKGQWRGALIFSLICVWINGWVNNREAGDLIRHRYHCDGTVVGFWYFYIGAHIQAYHPCIRCVLQVILFSRGELSSNVPRLRKLGIKCQNVLWVYIDIYMYIYIYHPCNVTIIMVFLMKCFLSLLGPRAKKPLSRPIRI